MYRQIKDHKPTREIYADFLENKIAPRPAEAEEIRAAFHAKLEEDFTRRVRLQAQQSRLA